MGDLIAAASGFKDALHNGILTALSYLPKIVLAIAVLLLGWLIARFVRYLVIRAASELDKAWHTLSARFQFTPIAHRIAPSKIIGELLFWVVLFVFIIGATDILGLGVFRLAGTAIFTFLPVLVGTVLLVVVGVIAGILVRDVIAASCDAAGLGYGNFLGRSVQGLILLVVIIISFDQLGLDIIFLSLLIGIVLASVLGGVGLAFALGARLHVSNLLSAKKLKERIEVGDTVRIDDVEGQIADIGSSHVSIENEESTIYVPAAIFDNKVLTVIRKGGKGASR